MNEWNAIDLHMHTVSGITRDTTPDDVNFSYELFYNVISKYKMKLMAVTNHNYIDMTNYILMRYLGHLNNTNILLGVELDSSLTTGKEIHIACIFNDNLIKNYYLSKEIDECVKKKISSKEVVFTNDEIINLLNKYDLFMIPHGAKHRGVFENADFAQIMEALKKIKEGFIRIFDSPSDWKLSRIKSFLSDLDEKNLDDFGGVLFSDNRDWTNYEKKYREFFMNAEPTFKGLIHAATNPTKRFKPKQEIKYNTNYIKKIVLKNKNNLSKINEGEIIFSSNYNCVIGKSGSGKSLLLHLIKKELLNPDIVVQNYSFAENTNIEIYNEENEQLGFENINVGVGERFFDKIIAAASTKENKDYYSIVELLNSKFQKKKAFESFKNRYNSTIKNYCNYVEKIKTNKNTLTILLNKYNADISKLSKLKNVTAFNLSNNKMSSKIKYSLDDIDRFKDYTKDLNNLEEKLNIYNGIWKKNIKNKLDELEKSLYLVLKEMEYEHYSYTVSEKKYNLINDAITKINKRRSTQSADKSKLLISLPNTRLEICKMALDLYIYNCKKDSINLSIKEGEYNLDTYLSSNITIKETINKEIFLKVDERDNMIFKTHGKKAYLKNKIYNLFLHSNAKELIDKYVELDILDSKKDAIVDTLDVNIDILFDGKNIKELNPGSIAKKYIELYFSEKVNSGIYNVVLFDQIENDVDKEFINNVIRELIEQTKGNVQLIVVTHDPIISVNADPNNYIEALKENEIISYRNFVAESSLRDELNTIACTVDGSKDVIRKRYEIYEGDREYGN